MTSRLSELLFVARSEIRALRMRRQTDLSELVCNLFAEANFPPRSICDGLQATCAQFADDVTTTRIDHHKSIKIDGKRKSESRSFENHKEPKIKFCKVHVFQMKL